MVEIKNIQDNEDLEEAEDLKDESEDAEDEKFFKDTMLELRKMDIKTDMGLALIPSEKEFVESLFYDDDVHCIYIAARILATFNKEDLMVVADNFRNYTHMAQVNLIPVLATTKFYESYVLLFELLMQKDSKETFDNLIIEALATTDYFIFPLLLIYIDKSEDDLVFHSKMKRLVLKIGFERLSTHLGMFYELPNEVFFREVFGDEDIDNLKKQWNGSLL
ncbi:hypothetical protein ACFLZV_07035 [Candidatus Margulisiibacteriota bacterium]